MPYIHPLERMKYDQPLNQLITALLDLRSNNENKMGDLNYCLSTLIWKWWKSHPSSYASANELIGVLECVKQEFYRRQVAPYEDAKCQENGDLL